MRKGEEELPKIFHIGGWAVAVCGVAVFVFSFGMLVYERMNQPISAQSNQNTCPTTSQVAINNYPGNGIVFNSKVNYFTRMGDNSWRCSKVCVNGYNNQDSPTSAANKKALDDYLAGMTVNGKKIQVVETAQDFDQKVADNQKEDVIIRSSLKSSCVGPDSKDYDLLSSSGQRVDLLEKNNTYKESKKMQDEIAQKAAKEAQNSPAAPAEKGLPVPVSRKQASGSTVDSKTAIMDDYRQCRDVTFTNFMANPDNQKALDPAVWDKAVQMLKTLRNSPTKTTDDMTLEKLKEWDDWCNQYVTWLQNQIGAQPADQATADQKSLNYDPNQNATLRIIGNIAVSLSNCPGGTSSSPYDYECPWVQNDPDMKDPTHVCAYLKSNPKSSNRTVTFAQNGYFIADISTTIGGITQAIGSTKQFCVYASNDAGIYAARNMYGCFNLSDFTEKGWVKWSPQTADSRYEMTFKQNIALRGNAGTARFLITADFLHRPLWYHTTVGEQMKAFAQAVGQYCKDLPKVHEIKNDGSFFY